MNRTKASPELDIRVPEWFLVDTAPRISSIEEMQVCLAVFRILAMRGGYETPIDDRSIVRDPVLRQALKYPGGAKSSDQRIDKGLELALGRNTLIRVLADSGARQVWWYFLNTAVNRVAINAIQRGALRAPSIMWETDGTPAVSVERPSVYRTYEQNIGPLTPLIADQLSSALDEFPSDWIEDAIEESVSYNRRSWRYILRILETWQLSGRST